jgi:hypothetical protein
MLQPPVPSTPSPNPVSLHGSLVYSPSPSATRLDISQFSPCMAGSYPGPPSNAYGEYTAPPTNHFQPRFSSPQGLPSQGSPNLAPPTQPWQITYSATRHAPRAASSARTATIGFLKTSSTSTLSVARPGIREVGLPSPPPPPDQDQILPG